MSNIYDSNKVHPELGTRNCPGQGVPDTAKGAAQTERALRRVFVKTVTAEEVNRMLKKLLSLRVGVASVEIFAKSKEGGKKAGKQPGEKGIVALIVEEMTRKVKDSSQTVRGLKGERRKLIDKLKNSGKVENGQKSEDSHERRPQLASNVIKSGRASD